MRTSMLGLVLGLAALGQDAGREFPLRAPGNLKEIVTTLQVVGKIQQLQSDAGSGTLTVKGNALELALAEWLVPQLDSVTAGGAGAQEYRVSANDVVLVYSLAHTATSTGMQEILTTLRTVGEIQQVYNVNAAKVIPLRGTSSQIALAKFMISELDVEEQQRETPVIHKFVSSEDPSTGVVYGLVHTPSTTSLQEILTTLRAVAQVQRVYNVTGPKLLCFRETPEMVPVVDWLISQLNGTRPNTDLNEMRMPGSRDDVIRVFYPAHISNGTDLQAMVTTLRKSATIPRIYTNSVPPAVVVRGTADHIHLVGQLIAQNDVASESQR